LAGFDLIIVGRFWVFTEADISTAPIAGERTRCALSQHASSEWIYRKLAIER